MTDGKWIEFTITSYVGIAMALVGVLVPNLLEIKSTLIKLLGAIVFIVGVYMVIKGRKTRGL